MGAAGLYIGDGGAARIVVVTGLVLQPDSNLEIACHPSDLIKINPKGNDESNEASPPQADQ